MNEQQKAEQGAKGTGRQCLFCGDPDATIEVSHGPNEPTIGVICKGCEGEPEDPQALIGADHYHIEWDEPVGLDF